MSGQEDFLKKLIDALENAGIPYMVSGSIGSSFHGRPRATNDFDVIVAPSREQLSSLISTLGSECYLNSETAQEALKNTTIFNVIDHGTGTKADLILLRQRDFSRQEFQRRQKVNVLGIDIWIVSPEDAILSKLEWCRDSESTMHLQDALGVAVVQWEKLDRTYLKKWANKLQLEGQLEQLLNEAQKLLD